jgi:parvulin-like peptidyl-prolyl isomerase
VALTALFACAGPSDSPDTLAGGGLGSGKPQIGVVDGLGRDDVPPSTMVDARPAALVEGRIVDWGELQPLLNEAAGADVLAEVILDRMLEAELDDAGILITDQDVDAERALFYSTLSDDPDVAARLARQVRARQGLGPLRMDELLKRNAALRALVRDQVEINDEAVRRMYEIIHGAKRQARLIVVPTLNDAQAAINRVAAGELFADVAVEVSTDTSAARGGLLEPISRADASYPQAMREALWALVPGELSRPVFLSDRYAVLSLVRVVDGDGADFSAVRPDLERLARLNQERILMDDLTRRLLTEANVTIIDNEVKWSWDSRRNR